MYLGAPILGVYMLMSRESYIILSLYSVLLYLSSRLCFKVYFLWYMILWHLLYHFHLHIFHSLNLCVSFALQWVSCRQRVIGSLFPPICYSVSFGALSLLTFDVIIDSYVFIAILNLVLSLILCFFFVPFFFYFSFCGLMIFSHIMLMFFFFFLIYCMLLICSYSVKYVNPFIYLLTLD